MEGNVHDDNVPTDFEVPTQTCGDGILPFDLESMLERAAAVGKGQRDDTSAVLRDIVSCTAGEVAHVMDVLAKTSGFNRPTLAAMLFDEKCRFKGGAIVIRPIELAGAWVSDTLESLNGGDLVRCNNRYHMYSTDEGQPPVYRVFPAKMVEDGLEGDAPYHPLLQQVSSRKDVFREVALQLQNDEFFVAAPAGLLMQNGFLSIDPETGERKLLPHGPEHRARHLVPADYDPNATCPTFDKGLAAIMPDPESRSSLMEILGSVVNRAAVRGDNACSAVLIIGPPNSGKSSIAKLIEQFVPADEIAALQPADMNERFMTASLKGVRMNIVTELDTERPIGGSALKAIMSKEMMTTRGIREAPTTFAAQAGHIFMSNELPTLKDNTGALSRRFCCFSLPRSLSRANTDPDYRAKVATELAGIVNLFAAGVERAIQRGYFAKPPEHDELMAEMRGGRDVITQAIAQCIAPADRSAERVTNQQLFDVVRQYALAKDLDISDLSLTTLGRRVADALRKLYKVEQEPTKFHGGVPQYRGIQVRRGPQQGSGDQIPMTAESLENI